MFSLDFMDSAIRTVQNRHKQAKSQFEVETQGDYGSQPSATPFQKGSDFDK